VVFECTGVAPLLQPTAELVRRGGTLSLVGYTTEPSQVSYGDWVARELRVVASLAHVHDDFLGAMRALEIGAVEVGPLVTAVVGLAGLGECSRSWAPGARRSQGARRPVGGRHRHGLTPAARRSPGAGRGPGRLTR
jgi:threonine dehydrogenase-like Zn-dependent dehydrogenase